MEVVVKPYRPEASHAQYDGSQESAIVRNGTQASANSQAHAQNAIRHPKIEIRQPSVTAPTSSAPREPPRPSAVLHPQIVIKAPSSSQQSSRPVVYEDQESQARKRKRGDDLPLDLTIDQRQKAEAALNQFNDHVEDLLQQADNYDAAYTQSGDTFVNGVVTTTGGPVLSLPSLKRLGASIKSLATNSATSAAPLDDLLALQKLCVGTVSVVETSSLSLGSEPGEGDVDDWLQRVDLGVGSLQAARLVLRLMTAGREEKQLYSEDTFGPVVRALEVALDTLIIPVIEARNSGATSSIFKMYQEYKKKLSSFCRLFDSVLGLFADLVTKVAIADTSVTKALYLGSRMIFVENGSTEKEAALGIQTYENLRRGAMDVLARIYGRYQEQRSSIFNEILSSLERLPVARQSARHFKVVDGKSIQLVSALLMRLIQTSAISSQAEVKNVTKKTEGRKGHEDDEKEKSEDDDEDNDSDAEGSEDEEYDPQPRAAAQAPPSSSIEDAAQFLEAVVEPLHKDAWDNARQVGGFLIQRAFRTTKTGDEPYRNLLDLFTEDFLGVLGLPEWPAAELILRALALTCVNITRDDKQTVPAKNAALDLLGTMGSGIADVQGYVRRASHGVEVPRVIANLIDQISEDHSVSIADLTSEYGPFAMVLGFLQSQDLKEPQILSASAYNLMHWGMRLIDLSKEGDAPRSARAMMANVREMTKTPGYAHAELKQYGDNAQQARLAAGIIALRSPFCVMQKTIISTVFMFMTGQQITLRNRSLKSALQLIEKDPDILDRNTYALAQINQCTNDTSSQVRDSALNLLARCLALRPVLDKQVYQKVIAALEDEAPLVRKRAMRVLKEMYLRSKDDEIKISIAAGLLTRTKDAEDSICELARQTFDDIWITPGEEVQKSSDRVERMLAFENIASMIVKTAMKSDRDLLGLEQLLDHLLTKESSRQQINTQVCKDIVTAMMDAVIDNEDRPGKPSQPDMAFVLTAFARAQPMLFRSEQVSMLGSYLRNLQNDRLPLFRSVSTIFRHILPALSKSLGNDYLRTVQQDLMKAIASLPKPELHVTIGCLSIICQHLEDDSKLANLLKSVLKPTALMKDMDLSRPENEKRTNQARRYIQLAGALGKEHNFDPHLEMFKKEHPSFKGNSVSALIVDILFPFTRKGQPKVIRQVALDSIGMICMAWPQNYLRADVHRAFESVFINNEDDLSLFVMTGIKDFLASEEQRSASGAIIKVGEGAVHGQERLANSFVATNNDGATTAIAQTFLDHVARIALCHMDESALVATQIIASINRQGLLHPKECGLPLVALTTAKNSTIAKIAFEEHSKLHHKHESMFEKEYMSAVQKAYEYQRDVHNDPRGVGGMESKPKLGPVYEVLKNGSAKVRKRFLDNICAKVDLDLATLDTNGKIPDKVSSARFILENLAFFEYPRADEVLGVTTALEKLVTAGTGTVVAHAIDLEILKINIAPGAVHSSDVTMPSEGGPHSNGFVDTVMHAAAPAPTTIDKPVSPTRKRQLVVASMIMLMAWETRTHLRNLWGLQKLSKLNVKAQAKDLGKAPTKINSVSGDKYLDKISHIAKALTSEETQFAQCQAYAELMSIDHEVRINDDDQDIGFDDAEQGASDGETRGPMQAPYHTLKRKNSGSTAPGTPKKIRRTTTGGAPRGRSKGSKNKKRASKSGDEGSDEGLDAPWF